MDRLNYLSFAATDMLSEEEAFQNLNEYFDENPQSSSGSQAKGGKKVDDSLEPSLQMGNTQLQTQMGDVVGNNEILDNMQLDEYRHLLTSLVLQNKKESLQERAVKSIISKNKSGSRYPKGAYFPQKKDVTSPLSKKPIRINRDLFEHFFVKLHYRENLASILSSLIARLILSDLNDIFDKSLALQSSIKRINKGRKNNNGTEISKLAMNWRHILLTAKGHLSEKEIIELRTIFESMFNK
jgi:hypothetical protein